MPRGEKSSYTAKQKRQPARKGGRMGGRSRVGATRSRKPVTGRGRGSTSRSSRSRSTARGRSTRSRTSRSRTARPRRMGGSARRTARGRTARVRA